MSDTITKQEFSDTMNGFVSEFRLALKHIYQRFDDIDNRFERLECMAQSIKDDTEMLMPIMTTITSSSYHRYKIKNLK